LWGWLAHIPGIKVVVPSNPSDAGNLMISAIKHEHPVVYLEHKLLADYWLDSMGSGGRKNVKFNVPKDGSKGLVPDRWDELPIGKLKRVREGTDITLVSVGVDVHKCLEAAKILKGNNISVEVLDLRWISPLDKMGLIESVEKTGSLVVVDEDYKSFGLSGEICAILKEEGLSFEFGRVCTETVIPYSRTMEQEVLPQVNKITRMVEKVLE
jgi:pyruvate dehydrogenase E1 component beta subunit